MAKVETWLNCDLKKPVIVHHMNGNMFSHDESGNLIGVNVFSDGEPVTLSGTVIGYCIVPDGTTISIAGTRSGNQAYIILPETALLLSGMVNIVIKLSENNAVTTLAAIVSSVFKTRTDISVTPSQQTIDDWTAQINSTIATLESRTVRYDANQSLTPAEKTRARNNIGANASAVLIYDENYRIVVP